MLIQRQDTVTLDDGLVVTVDYGSDGRLIRVVLEGEDGDASHGKLSTDPEVIERTAAVLARLRQEMNPQHGMLVCADHGYQQGKEAAAWEDDPAFPKARVKTRRMRCPKCIEIGLAEDSVDRLRGQPKENV